MYHVHRILSSVIRKLLHKELVDPSYKEWVTYYSTLSSEDQGRMRQLHVLLGSITEVQSEESSFDILLQYNILCFDDLSGQELQKFSICFKEICQTLDLASYSAQRIEELFLNEETGHINTSGKAIKHYASRALGSLTIAHLINIYNKFLENGWYDQEWHAQVLQSIYSSVRHKLISTRISNEDIAAFKQFEIYNSIYQRLQNTRLSLACSRYKIHANNIMWSDFFFKVANAYNKYKGLLSYLEVYGTNDFKDFCQSLESAMLRQQSAIEGELSKYSLSPVQIERIERLIHEDEASILNAPPEVELLQSKHLLGRAMTELHLLVENNYLPNNSGHRLELHQYYQALDAFQKQQLTSDFKDLMTLTLRFMEEPHLASRVINNTITGKIARSYYPDELFSNSQIENSVDNIQRKLSQIDFSHFFDGMEVRGKLVNKFINKILNNPRPFHDEHEYLESIIASVVMLLGNKQTQILIDNMSSMSEEVRNFVRRETAEKLQHQTGMLQFLSSRVNKKKRQEYSFVKKLQKELVV